MNQFEILCVLWPCFFRFHLASPPLRPSCCGTATVPRAPAAPAGRAGPRAGALEASEACPWCSPPESLTDETWRNRSKPKQCGPENTARRRTAYLFFNLALVWAAVLCERSNQDLYWDIVNTDGIRSRNSPQHAASATSTNFFPCMSHRPAFGNHFISLGPWARSFSDGICPWNYTGIDPR